MSRKNPLNSIFLAGCDERSDLTIKPSVLMMLSIGLCRKHGKSPDLIAPGIGLSGMRERVKELDGSLELNPMTTGFELSVRLPLAATTRRDERQHESQAAATW